MNFKEPQGQIARWLEELGQYDMLIQHRPGKKHLNADALSRIPETLEYCPNYRSGFKLEHLPCQGCPYCTRAHNNWSNFLEEVDYVVALPQKVPILEDSGRQIPIWKITQMGPMGSGILKHSTLEITDSSDSSSRIVRTVTAEDELDLSKELIQETAKDSNFELVLPWLSDGTVPSE